MRFQGSLLCGAATLAAFGAATSTTESTSTEMSTAESTSTVTISISSSSIVPDSTSTQVSTSALTTTEHSGSSSISEPTTTTTLTTTSVTTVTVSGTSISISTTSIAGSGSLSTTTTATATTSLPSNSGFPELSNRFRFLGCVESRDNYPTFFLGAKEKQMTIGRCTAACHGFDYAGVHDTDCYCGRAVDGTRTRTVPTDECNIPCPGNDAEFCGGNLLLRKSLGRRSNRLVPNNILLTMYANADIMPPPVSTITTTVKPHPSYVICHDGRCDPVVIILEPHKGEDCYGEIVYEKITCKQQHCDYEHSWDPFRCDSDRCKGRIVYKPRECTRDCDNDIIVIERPCHACEGGVIYIDQVIVVPVTIHRNHTRVHTITRPQSHTRSHTITLTSSITATTSISLCTTTSTTNSMSTHISNSTSTHIFNSTSTHISNSTSTSTSASTPTSISLPASTSTSTSTQSSTPNPYLTSATTSTPTSDISISSSTRGDPRGRIIDGPTETTDAAPSQTSPTNTQTSHVVVAGAGRTAVSVLSAVIAALLFL